MQYQFKTILKIAVLIALISMFTGFLVKYGTTCTIGFVSGYTAAVGLWNGEPVVSFYDNDSFHLLVQDICTETVDIYAPNIPTYGYLFLPLVAFSFGWAKIIWILFSLGLLLISYRTLHKHHLKQWSHLDIILLVLAFYPLYLNIQMGQAYIFLLALLVLVWHGWRTERYILAGVALALITVFKVGIIGVWPVLLFARQWKILGVATGLTLGVFLGTLPWVGWESWIAFFNAWLHLSELPEGAVTAYQSLPTMFRHLFSFQEHWNPHPIYHSELWGQVVPRWMSPVVILGSVILAIRIKNIDFKIAILIIGALIASPLALDYHYVVMLLPMALLYPYVAKQKSSHWKWLFFMAFFLIALPIPYRSSLIAKGFLALLAYPELYAAVILGYLSLKLSKR